MKKVWLFVLMDVAVLSSCKNTQIEDGEACSIKVSGVEFTKSLNDAKSLATITDGKLVFKCRANVCSA